jgi:hypothetical protein
MLENFRFVKLPLSVFLFCNGQESQVRVNRGYVPLRSVVIINS